MPRTKSIPRRIPPTLRIATVTGTRIVHLAARDPQTTHTHARLTHLRMKWTRLAASVDTWVAANPGLGGDTVQRYMRVRERVAHLPIPS